MKDYDVVVVGAGHAGCEAALAAARAGAMTLLLTINLDHVALMSCNPAVGGIAKGQLVREIDALGGAQGIVTDHAAVQFRMLNQAKGPAVRSPRSQCDKSCYARSMKYLLEQTSNLDLIQGEVLDFMLEDGQIVGIRTQYGDEFRARAVVLTTGTSLSGKLHYGLTHFFGGRAGDPASTALAVALREQLGLRLGRLKTGTPPRVAAKSIDFSAMTPQYADAAEEEFSFWHENLSDHERALPSARRHDMPCFQVYSTDATAQIVRENLQSAPLYQGKIEGIGARYCPSFEDKVVRFPHHERHLLYLEPEGADTAEYYINGISTSLPPSIQKRMLHSVPGMERAVISRYAYAIEYDFIFPDQLYRTLATKSYPNLFPAGQINGTSGYEEAAGQGLLAGLNAARYAGGLATVEMPRGGSYLGVMIDDLVTKEIVEPYRLFTSRAEFRLHLRQDNADLRLAEFAWQHHLLPEAKYRAFTTYRNQLEASEQFLRGVRKNGKSAFDQLKDLKGLWNPQALLPFDADHLPVDPATAIGRKIMRQLTIQAHYEGYIAHEIRVIDKLARLESWTIPEDFSYDSISALGTESRLKLNKVRPTTLAQAGRIDGVTPSQIALLQVHLTRLRKEPK